jgi:hypothetical protein
MTIQELYRELLMQGLRDDAALALCDLAESYRTSFYFGAALYIAMAFLDQDLVLLANADDWAFEDMEKFEEIADEIIEQETLGTWPYADTIQLLWATAAMNLKTGGDNEYEF